MDVVFHCATVAPAAANTANRRLMHDVNVAGTQHVLDACAAAGVRRLVYTSSASVRACSVRTVNSAMLRA
jgi:nucleoside-diphosphate-sugar epimerase